jgi:predicted nucleotidyltransferase
MQFAIHGNADSTKRGMLLHGLCLDAAQFDSVRRRLERGYCLIIPTFDGHYADNKTEFTSLDNQVDQILDYLDAHGLTDLDFIVGVSLGALAAFEIYKRKQLRVRTYFFDGGPFFKTTAIRKKTMAAFFGVSLAHTHRRGYSISLGNCCIMATSDLLKSRESRKIVYSIPEISQIVSPIARSYGINRLSVFGSYARGDATPGSDIDFLIIDPGSLRGLFQLSGFQLALEEHLDIPVDVLTKDCLDERFLSYIEDDEVVIYES